MAQILIVEECDLRLTQLQSALSSHKLVCTRNVDRALTAVRTRHFDLLVAPIYLESGDVFHLIRTASETSQRLRIVLYSTDKEKMAKYATTSIQSAARFLGVYRYVLLQNPDVRDLRSELENCISSECWSKVSFEAGTIYEI